MKQEKKFGSLSSSADPSKLSLTVESVAKVILGLVAWYAANKGLDPTIATNYLQQVVEMTLAAIPAGYTAFHSLQGAWGLTRKLFLFITAPNIDPLAPHRAEGDA